MKLIIQIPCYNEAATLPATLKELPSELEGIDSIEYLVIDDGSTDETVKVARQEGVHHVIRLTSHQGLGRGFRSGLNECLKQKADIIVNTDADNQYYAEDIRRLIEPILERRADMVIGARGIEHIEHFSSLKKSLQKLGSWVVRRISHTRVPDATSGFRAFNRNAALRLNVFTSYTYTLETIIQAGFSNIVVTSVPIRTNDPTRESRLISSVPSYVHRSILTMLRVFVLYKPLRFFFFIGSVVFGLGVVIGLRFSYYYFLGQGEGMIQSLILAAVLILAGFQMGVVGLLSDLISTNRRILEEIQYQMRKRDLDEAS